VGIPEREEDDEPFEEKMLRLTDQLYTQFAKSQRLEAEIRKNLEALGYGD
jgi:type I restriction enzyme M protein